MTTLLLRHLWTSALLIGACAISSPSHAQPTSDVCSSQGQHDQFAVGGAHRWFDNPLAIIKRLEQIKKAVEVIGKAGSIYAIYEDIKSYDPTADPYETGKWLGKLICDGKDLGDMAGQTDL